MNVEAALFSEEFGIKYVIFPSFAFFLVSVALVPVVPSAAVALFFVALGYVLLVTGFLVLLASKYHDG